MTPSPTPTPEREAFEKWWAEESARRSTGGIHIAKWGNPKEAAWAGYQASRRSPPPSPEGPRNSPKVIEAAKTVLDKLGAMTDEEFAAKLDAHKNGDVANLLAYAMEGASFPEADEMDRIRRHYQSSTDWEWLGHLLIVIDKLRTAALSPRPAPEVGELRERLIDLLARMFFGAGIDAVEYAADRILAILPPKPADEKGTARKFWIACRQHSSGNWWPVGDYVESGEKPVDGDGEYVWFECGVTGIPLADEKGGGV